MTQLEEVTLDEIRHLVSDRAIEGDTMLLNMGPQHPSTHGVLRLLLELDGETISTASQTSATCTPVLRKTWRLKPTPRPR